MTTSAPRPSVILFDLDGTLIDTVAEIADAVNDALAELLGQRRLEDALVESWIGNGAGRLFRLALRHCGIAEASLEDEFDARWSTFHSAYAQRCGSNSHLYPGVESALQALQRAGYRLGVLTNKEGRFANKVIGNHALQDYFDVVIAGDTLETKKPDPKVLLAALDRLETPRSEALFIGDSMIDLKTGAAAEVRTWAVTHGYHHGEFEKPLPESLRPERFIQNFD